MYARGTFGVKVATEPVDEYMTVPRTEVLPGPASVNVAVLMEAPFMGSLKVAVRI